MTSKTVYPYPKSDALRDELRELLSRDVALSGLGSLVDQATLVIDGLRQSEPDTPPQAILASGMPHMVVHWSSQSGLFAVTVCEVLATVDAAHRAAYSWVGVNVSTLLKIKSVDGQVICVMTHAPSQGSPIHFYQRVSKGMSLALNRTEIPLHELLDRFPREVERVIDHIAFTVSALFGVEGY